MKSLKELQEVNKISMYKSSQSKSSIGRVPYKIDFLGEGIAISDKAYSKNDTTLGNLSGLRRA